MPSSTVLVAEDIVGLMEMMMMIVMMIDSDDSPGEHDHDQGVEDERDEHQQGHHHAVDRQHL